MVLQGTKRWGHNNKPDRGKAKHHVGPETNCFLLTLLPSLRLCDWKSYISRSGCMASIGPSSKMRYIEAKSFSQCPRTNTQLYSRSHQSSDN